MVIYAPKRQSILSIPLIHEHSYMYLMLSICRAGGAGPVAQAMAGPIFETFQDFSSGHMFVQAIEICVLVACKLSSVDARFGPSSSVWP